MTKSKNVLAHLLQHQELEDSIRRFFRLKSKFWKAFYNYINECEITLCPFFNSNGPIYHSSGISGIQWVKAYAHPPGAGPNSSNVIRIIFSVVTSEEDEYEGKLKQSEIVDVPIKLISKFKRSEFDAWIAVQEEAHRVHRLLNAKEALDAVYKKYPELNQPLVPSF